MSSRGFVYVMTNPSLKGLVKVGRTTRPPSERVYELSSATGVPTPFQLVYFAEFADCSHAERALHALFTEMGVRINGAREFFRLPVHEAVAAVVSLSARENAAGDAAGLVSSSEPRGLEETAMIAPVHGEMATRLYDEGAEYEYGLNDRFIDVSQALVAYKKAAALSSGPACLALGRLLSEDKSEFKDVSAAKNYLIRGAQLGVVECLLELATLFEDNGELQNAERASVKASKFLDRLDLDNRAHYVMRLVEFVGKRGLAKEIASDLLPYHSELTMHLDECVERVKREDSSEGKYHLIGLYRAQKALVGYVMFGEMPDSKLGRITSTYDASAVSGEITGDDGVRYDYDSTRMLAGCLPPRLHRRVQFYAYDYDGSIESIRGRETSKVGAMNIRVVGD
jgi:TPR repeat protein